MREETANGQQRWKNRRIKVKTNGFRPRLFFVCLFLLPASEFIEDGASFRQ